MAASASGNDPSLVGGGTISALNASTPSFRPSAKGTDRVSGRFNFSIRGTFVGTVVIERSFDNGTNWFNVPTDANGTANAFTAPVSLQIDEPEGYVAYRARFSAYTSGSAIARFSQ